MNIISRGTCTQGATLKPDNIAGHCKTWEGRHTEHAEHVILVNIDGVWGYVCTKHANDLIDALNAAINEAKLLDAERAREAGTMLRPSDALRQLEGP